MSQIVDQIADRLGADIRLTRGRREVVDALTRARGPLSAAEIHLSLDGGVPLSSIYRTLTVLTDAEVVALHRSRDGVTRYELAEPLQHHHHHLVCVECGRIEDVQFDEPAEIVVHEIVSRVASGRGFRAVSHTLEIEGSCERCS
ncbi:MAG: transcriptional repressor [Acidobacteria bacterium]|nr:transcriptional repressor [Acidobacteriota bacterium]